MFIMRVSEGEPWDDSLHYHEIGGTVDNGPNV
jgi:hypothetical protein